MHEIIRIGFKETQEGYLYDYYLHHSKIMTLSVIDTILNWTHIKGFREWSDIDLESTFCDDVLLQHGVRREVRDSEDIVYCITYYKPGYSLIEESIVDGFCVTAESRNGEYRFFSNEGQIGIIKKKDLREKEDAREISYDAVYESIIRDDMSVLEKVAILTYPSLNFC